MHFYTFSISLLCIKIRNLPITCAKITMFRNPSPRDRSFLLQVLLATVKPLPLPSVSLVALWRFRSVVYLDFLASRLFDARQSYFYPPVPLCTKPCSSVVALMCLFRSPASPFLVRDSPFVSRCSCCKHRNEKHCRDFIVTAWYKEYKAYIKIGVFVATVFTIKESSLYIQRIHQQF